MPRTCNKILCSYKTDERRSVQTSMNGFQAILSEKNGKAEKAFLWCAAVS